MAEFVVMWLDHADPSGKRPAPGTVLAIYPDGTLDSVTPAAASHVNFVHVDGLSVESAQRLVEQVWDFTNLDEPTMISRRRFSGDMSKLVGQVKKAWDAHQPLTFTEAQARAFITDKFGTEAW